RGAVAGSIGPTGDILEPSGPRTVAEATDIFREQASALADGGVDVLWLETLSSREECDAAATAAAETGLPYVMTVSFDTNGRTMMGLTPGDVRQFQQARETRPVAWGGNCGLGASEVVSALITAQRDNPLGEERLVAKANCGIPQYVDGKIVYSGTPDLMQRYAALSIDAGARIVGGCCGTTPAHLAAMRTVLDTHERGALPTLDAVEASLGSVSDGTRALFRGEATPKPARAGRRRPVRKAS
ncbi:MAG: homocysteine S-methyltransferase family protein, partial [Pseudomonadota bacterium]